MASDEDQAEPPGDTSLGCQLVKKKTEREEVVEEEFKKSFTEFIRHTT